MTLQFHRVLLQISGTVTIKHPVKQQEANGQHLHQQTLIQQVLAGALRNVLLQISTIVTIKHPVKQQEANGQLLHMAVLAGAQINALHLAHGLANQKQSVRPLLVIGARTAELLAVTATKASILVQHVLQHKLRTVTQKQIALGLAQLNGAVHIVHLLAQHVLQPKNGIAIQNQHVKALALTGARIRDQLLDQQFQAVVGAASQLVQHIHALNQNCITAKMLPLV